MFKEVDMDKLEGMKVVIIVDMMDDMEDMKAESEYMNEMMNRNYAIDIDEDELDREMQEIDNDMYMETLNNQQKNRVPG
jgi:charged multivesicular body protein 5